MKQNECEKLNFPFKRVRIKRGYGWTDGWRTDGRMSGGRTDGRTDGWLSNNVFQPFFSHIRVLSKRIKRGYGPKNVFSLFLVISAFYPKG